MVEARIAVNKMHFRITGYALFIMAIIAGLGYGVAFESFYTSDSAEQTFKNLREAPQLLRYTIVSFTSILLLDVVVTVTLYCIFKMNQEFLSLLMAFFRLVYTAMLGAAIFFLLSAQYSFEKSGDNAAGLQRDLDLFLKSWNISLIVFGIHLVLLGVVTYRSRFISPVIGYTVVFAGICYVVKSLLELLLPSYKEYAATADNILSLPMALGELLLAGWLIYNACKKNKPEI